MLSLVDWKQGEDLGKKDNDSLSSYNCSPWVVPVAAVLYNALRRVFQRDFREISAYLACSSQ